MAQIEEEFSSSVNKVSVSIRKVTYSENETFIGRVSRNTVNIDNMINSICEKIPSYDKYELKRFAKDLKAEVLSSIATGKSVNLLDLGTLYIALSGSMKNAPATASEISSLTVKFSPSKTLVEGLENVEIDKIVYADTSPVISKVECLWEDVPEKSVMVNKIVQVTGSRLKLEGDNSGVFFCARDDDGNAEKDESKWTKAVVIRNLPKTLELYVPAGLEAGRKYLLAVKTRPSASGVYSVGFSSALSIAE